MTTCNPLVSLSLSFCYLALLFRLTTLTSSCKLQFRTNNGGMQLSSLAVFSGTSRHGRSSKQHSGPEYEAIRWENGAQ